MTVQIGDGAALAAATGIDVVYDLRAADCAAGGQGAPLAPVYHRALAAKLPERPIAFVNIGGVANVTWIGPTNRADRLRHRPRQRHDRRLDAEAHGRAARRGRRARARRARCTRTTCPQYLRHSLFRRAGAEVARPQCVRCLQLVDPLSTEDGAATLTAFTAAASPVARAPARGAAALGRSPAADGATDADGDARRARARSRRAPAEALGFDGDAVEAEAWAYLAVRSLDGLPITFPGTTGVPCR